MKTIQYIIYIAVILTLASCSSGSDSEPSPNSETSSGPFDERWESAALGSYSPATSIPLINADEGDWLIGDTVSNFSECGTTPHSADIISANGDKALRLTSTDSGSSCSDNVWLVIDEVPAGQINMGFSVPLSVNSLISFDEIGSLVNPQTGSANCIVKPCGDTISLMLSDNRGNVLAYILQRAANAQPSTSLLSYREYFLDSANGSYSRDLYADFRRIPNFQKNGAVVASIEFKIQEHGTATLDNISIKDYAPDTSNPVQVTVADLAGIWRRQDPGHINQGKEYLIGGTGGLGSYSSGSYVQDSTFTWSLSGVTVTEISANGTRIEDIVVFDGVNMITERQSNGKFLTWRKQ